MGFKEDFMERWEQISADFNEIDAHTQPGDWGSGGDIDSSQATPNADEAILLLTDEVKTAMGNLRDKIGAEETETSEESEE